MTETFKESMSDIFNLSNLTFNVWIKQTKVTNDPCGDLIDDARTDRSLQIITIHDKKKLINHLHKRGASGDCIRTVPIVWKRYQRWLMRQI